MRWRSALLLLLLGFAAGALVFFLLQGGLLGLPTSPFGEDRQELSLVEEATLAERRLAIRFSELRPGRKPGKEIKVRLLETDLRDLALAGLSHHPEGLRVLTLANRVQVGIENGEIGFELVVDLEKIPRDLLTDKERETLEKVEGLVPVLGSELPIGFYGRPEASHGRLRFGGKPHIKISILKLSLGTVSERLGIPERELEESLVLEWPGYEVLDAALVDGGLELVVRTT